MPAPNVGHAYCSAFWLTSSSRGSFPDAVNRKKKKCTRLQDVCCYISHLAMQFLSLDNLRHISQLGSSKPHHRKERKLSVQSQMGRNRNPMWVLFMVVFPFLPMAQTEDEEVKQAMLRFMEKLEPMNTPRNMNWGWNMSSDPCIDRWYGVQCYSRARFVKNIVLEDFGFTGILDAASLCTVQLLQGLSLKNNNLHGLIPEEIEMCKALSLLYLSGNNFSGDLPLSISLLGNLKRIDVSDNNLSGDLPDMSHITGLQSFRAQNNKFTGEIPNFVFSNLEELNLSSNNLQGPIPDVISLFGADSFSGNPNLCGPPLENKCPSLPPPAIHKKHSGKSLGRSLAIYSGFVILGVLVLLYLTFKIVKRYRAKKEPLNVEKEEVRKEASKVKSPECSNEVNGIVMRSEYSVSSVEAGMTSINLVVLKSPVVRALRFEDLLRAPAELVGRGKHGSLYKVMLDSGMVLAAKRIKDLGISKQDFEKRMHKLDQVKHPCVLPLLAFYCSQQEKLLVYEFLFNGSLFKMLRGSQSGKTFGWGSRLNVAANIAEALAYMHEELRESGIAHGNLKSRNILFDKNMDPCLSEYGLMVVEDQDKPVFYKSSMKNRNSRNPSGGSGAEAYSTFKVDTYAFGVVLLELLTGKVVQNNNGFDLVRWVNSVVREEWTVEVFDKCLTTEEANEERMMTLLQIALKCVSAYPNERPNMSEVAVMTISLKEEEDRSITFNP
ncbi:probable inactive receptor kinase At2g26730 [Prosopis cineraria]|uniref:probable inactive receptor kinase At2g26730 n=1 Tax=Prosopis cineraria TaxID=364024 RepID=UPI00240F1763|nr:probable inactive receptor kinase At2g26730 [Prosopis cineraria]